MTEMLDLRGGPNGGDAVVGVDIGSIWTKAVFIRNGQVTNGALLRTGAVPEEAGETAVRDLLARHEVPRDEVGCVVATGYGRINLASARKSLPEITCVGRGAHALNPAVRTVIDIGGLDCKVVGLDPAGRALKFKRNDKCAAGTGRFIEKIAKILQLDLEQISQLSVKASGACSISSTCVVFAESEVVSALAKGFPYEDVIAGVNAAAAERVAQIVERLGTEGEVAMVGGMAKNRGFVAALETRLGVRFAPLPADPQYVEALGAALFAQELATGKEEMARR
ncbi:MAG: 2-hydroxyglutaryl-CoA dehydratase [Candidatus Rokubacteria bacterium]|nr:2-hydroxyglutaryl-CoA dehydratase [Candidatus Rokubacteria bacterium]